MGSPAPHTPVNFLKAGGGSFFSARCQKAIQDLGWDPDEFGDYDHTLSYIQKCRERVAAGDPTLTPRQRELGQPYYVPGSNPLQVNPNAFTSGHMYFNSTMQERGRGNDCTSRVDGYSMGGCPAMPHQGQTTDPGTQHNRHTVREYAGALNPDGTRTPGALYGGAATPAEATARAHADAEARARELVRERREQLGATSGTAGAAGGDAAASTATGPGAAAAASTTAPGAAGGSAAGGGGQVDGETAEDCLANFVKQGFAAMQSECAANASANAAAAGGTPPATAAEARAAEREAEDARRRARENPTPANQAAADAASRRFREMEAACRAAQGTRLAAGTPVSAPGQPANRGAGVPGTVASGVPPTTGGAGAAGV